MNYSLIFMYLYKIAFYFAISLITAIISAAVASASSIEAASA